MLAATPLRMAHNLVHPAPSPAAFPFSQIAHQVITIGRDAEVYSEACPASHVYKVLSGTLRTAKLLADGRRQVGSFVFAGEWVGFDGGMTHFYAAEAVSEARLLSFARRDLERLMAEDRDAARIVEGVLCDSLAAAFERIVSLGRKSATERVASFLVDIEGRIAERSKGGFVLPMSRGDIADYLGLTIETVSRTLGDLRRRHIIQVEDAHHVRILDPSHLAVLAGEDAQRYCA